MGIRTYFIVLQLKFVGFQCIILLYLKWNEYYYLNKLQFILRNFTFAYSMYLIYVSYLY